MPGFLTFFLNPYDRKARLRPALLCALPVFVSVVLMIPDFGIDMGCRWWAHSLLWRNDVSDTDW